MGYNGCMSLPDWLAPQPSKPRREEAAPLPGWLSACPDVDEVRTPVGKLSKEKRELLFTQYEMVLPRILDMLSGGYTLKKAFKELPIEIDHGGFIGWLKRDSKRWELYRNAKELRTEAWADDIIRHAEGEDEDGNPTMDDVARSRLKVDTYWKLMGANNRKDYGDTKTIEMNTSISITAALAEAQGRVIEAQVIDDEVDVIDATDYKRLPMGSEEDDDE